ncbi:MAG: hypothetical protein QOE33_3475 [Acidobacteriota bacterium]|nr:hypothetical protein [Acidobacteriota bacterium]
MARTSYFKQIVGANTRPVALKPPRALLQRWELTALNDGPDEPPRASRPSPVSPTLRRVSALNETVAPTINSDATAHAPESKGAMTPTVAGWPSMNSFKVIEREASERTVERRGDAQPHAEVTSPTKETEEAHRSSSRRAAANSSSIEPENEERRQQPQPANVAAKRSRQVSTTMITAHGSKQSDTRGTGERVEGARADRRKELNDESVPARSVERREERPRTVAAQTMLEPRAASAPSWPTPKQDKSAGATVSVGHIEVNIVPPAPPQPVVAKHPAQAKLLAPLSRGFITSFGLRQE